MHVNHDSIPPVAKATLFVILTLSLVIGSAQDCFAQPTSRPSGQVTFSGPGAGQLPRTTFIPWVFNQVGPAWTFFDVQLEVSVSLTIDPLDSTGANIVSVGAGGAVWAAISPGSPLSGVTIDGDTVTFENLTLDEVPTAAKRAQGSIVIDGLLSQSGGVPTKASTWGEAKSMFRR